MIRRPPRSTLDRSSAASDVYKRQTCLLRSCARSGEMATEIKLPRLGQGMESGTIVKWLKSEGEPVEKGEPLYELDTDKVTQDCLLYTSPSPRDRQKSRMPSSA